MDAALADAAAEDSGAPQGPAVGLTPESFASSVDEISDHGMIASSLASIIAEIASEPVVSAALSLRQVPRGDVADRAEIEERAENLPDCAGGTNHVDQCPAVIECGRRTFVSFGEGCLTPSGKRLTGTVLITQPLVGSQPWRWDLALALDSGDEGRVGFLGAIQMTRAAGSLLFNQRSDAIRVSMPRQQDRRADRTFTLLLSDISVAQGASGEFQVRGPDTYTIAVPVTCGGSSSSATFEIENCGQWTFPVPLTSCLCPISGNLRLIGPLMDPCDPSERQTLDLEFIPIDPQHECGQNMQAKAYFPDTQCQRSCGPCDDGTCLPRTSLCTNSIDVSSVVSGMVGWVCELPSSVCSTIFDGGACPSYDGSIPDGSDRDGGSQALDGGVGDANADGSLAPRDAEVDAGFRDANLPLADSGSFADAQPTDADTQPTDADPPHPDAAALDANTNNSDAAQPDATEPDATQPDATHPDAEVVADAARPDANDSSRDADVIVPDAGQITTTISGRVFNRDNGQGLGLSLVRAHSGATMVTPLNGNYTLAVPAQGVEDVTATHVNFLGARRYFTLTGGPLTNADLGLFSNTTADAIFTSLGIAREEGKGHVQVDVRPSPTVRSQTAQISAAAGLAFVPSPTGTYAPGSTVAGNVSNAFVFFANVTPGMISAEVFGDAGPCTSPDPSGAIEVSANIVTTVTFLCP